MSKIHLLKDNIEDKLLLTEYSIFSVLNIRHPKQKYPAKAVLIDYDLVTPTCIDVSQLNPCLVFVTKK